MSGKMKNDEERSKWMDERIVKGYSFKYNKGASRINESVTCVETGETFEFQWSDDVYFKQAAEKLWGLLDDIDTLSDVIKPTSLQGYAKFYHSAMEFARQRFNYLTSDGFELFLRKRCNQKISSVEIEQEEEIVDNKISG